MTALEPVWQELLIELAGHAPIVSDAGPREVPNWLGTSRAALRNAPPSSPTVETQSYATARHEVIEAFRWARALLADGKARAEDLVIPAASPGAYDDMVEAAADANLPLHFAHGSRAFGTREGQATAALADVLVHGLSQERMRRLIALARVADAPLHAPPTHPSAGKSTFNSLTLDILSAPFSPTVPCARKSGAAQWKTA